MKYILFALLFLTIFSCGCTVYQIDSKETSQDFYASKSNINDVVYMEKVNKPYTEIAIVTVTTERNQTLQNVLPKLKQEAAMLGADAITDIQSDSTDLWKELPSQKLLGNAYIRTNYTAKAIVWK